MVPSPCLGGSSTEWRLTLKVLQGPMPSCVRFAVKVTTNQRISYLHNFYTILYAARAVAVFSTDNALVLFPFPLNP